jgi:hypothetical protein
MMRRPRKTPQRDFTDTHLRRCASVLGFKGKNLPLRVADVLVHPNRPGESVALEMPGETRRAAADRLRDWSLAKPEPRIKVTVVPSERPVSREQLGEIAEKLLQILARARARKAQKLRDESK